VARTVLFAGKAAPGYYMAKLVIRLINDVASVIDADPASNGSLRVLFIPNYDVTTAGDIIPAAELSQQISTAGTEASGTGNMKLALNGALTMGTLDGANVEIRDSVGPENIFTFGHTEEQLQSLRREGYSPGMFYESDPELRRAIDQIGSGFFSPEEPGRYRALVDALIGSGQDRFMVCADFRAYLECSDEADRLYATAPSEWTRRAIINTAMMGRFSIDRTVGEYARRVWRTEPVTPEGPE
jgi:starch phosphorylase